MNGLNGSNGQFLGFGGSTGQGYQLSTAHNPLSANSTNPANPCLEDHRLMIDRAIDRLKGELQEKEKVHLHPLAYRQKSIQEDLQQSKSVINHRIKDLEKMVLMQEKTIRCLLDVSMSGVNPEIAKVLKEQKEID